MLESLHCNSCGAPLEVPESANFIKCNHCQASLQVNRSREITTTEAIEQLVETTEDLSNRVDKLTQESELRNLDRHWAKQRESLLVDPHEMASRVPPRSSAWIGGVFTTCFGVLWTVMAISMTQTAPDFGAFRVAKLIFPLFGAGFVLFGILVSLNAHRKAKEYESAERRYRQRRNKILRENP